MCVFSASNQYEAYRIAKHESLDVAIVDLRLVEKIDERLACGVSGIDVIRELKLIRPEIIAVLWSGFLSIAATNEAHDAGAAFCEDKLVPLLHVLVRIERGRRDAVPPAGTLTLARVEWEHMQRVLADTGNNMSETARRLGIQRSSLQRKLKRLPPPEFAAKTR